jgi:hypothetical protein
MNMKVENVHAYDTDALIRTKDSRTDWALCIWFKADNGKLSATYAIAPKLFDRNYLITSTNWDDIQRFIDDNKDEINRQLEKNCK